MSKVLFLIVLVVAVFICISTIAMVLWNVGVGEILHAKQHINLAEAMLLTAFFSTVTAAGRGGSSS